MKAGIAVAIVFVLYIAASFLTQGYIDKSAGELEQKAAQIEEAVASEDWDAAETGIGELYEQWEDHKTRWLLLEDHDKVDEIDEAIAMARDMIGIQEKPHSIDAVGRFVFHVNDVPDKGNLELGNIF